MVTSTSTHFGAGSDGWILPTHQGPQENCTDPECQAEVAREKAEAEATARFEARQGADPMTADLPQFLVDYLATREAQRADAITAVLGSLTERERLLVKEAAVMGYFQGTLHPRGEAHPKDSWVLATVIDACLVYSDLYPTISADPPAEAQPAQHRWYTETLDGVADQWAPSTRYTDRDEALERYRTVNERYPKWKDGTPVQRRFVRETTTYTVEDVPEPEQDGDGE